MLWKSLCAAFLLSLSLGTARPADGHQGRQASVPAHENERTDAILRILNDEYVHREVIEKAAPRIRARGRALAKLDDRSVARSFGPELSQLLRDRHVLLEYSTQARSMDGQAASSEPDAATKARMDEFARRVNYGFTEVRVLDGGIGYLRIDGFMPPDVAGPALESAMNQLRETPGLIIDLRESLNGGDPAMVALVCAYLIPDQGRLLTTMHWRNRAKQENRIPVLDPARRYPDNKPVVVLTSQKTFSAGEELAYNLKALGRARLIGEATRGGANPGREHQVTAHLSIFVPEGEAISAVTGGNWNWTGVLPHERINPAKALDRAIQWSAGGHDARLAG